MPLPASPTLQPKAQRAGGDFKSEKPRGSLRPMDVKAFSIFVLLGLLACGKANAESEAATFFVQTIVGTNQEGAHHDDKTKTIGPQLRRDLSPVFQWKHYREVRCQKIEVRGGKVSRIQMTAERGLELEIAADKQLELRLFRDAKLVRRMTNPLSQGRIIMGGDRNKDEAWFVVVRRDKPSTE